MRGLFILCVYAYNRSRIPLNYFGFCYRLVRDNRFHKHIGIIRVVEPLFDQIVDLMFVI